MSVHSLTVVGGGNGAHVLAAVAGSRGFEVRLWAPIPEEAAALKKGVAQNGYVEAVSGENSFKAVPAIISAEPAEVIPGSGIIIFVLPAFAHKELLLQAVQYLDKGCILGAIPSRSGFEFMAKSILNDTVTIFGVQTLPWACRIKSYGRQVEILGTKNKVTASSSPASEAIKICVLLQELLGIEVIPAPNMLALTLGNVGQIIHPGIMYGLFYRWKGNPFSETEIPLFYQGVTEEIGLILTDISREIMDVKEAIEKEGISLEGVVSLNEWLLSSYENSIADTSTLKGCFNTNTSYRGLKAPVKKIGEDGYMPDFSSRYLTEDIPHGLVVTRALAQLTGIHTPVIDEVLGVTSGWMRKEYLVNGYLQGKDVPLTPIPQNYGINDIQGLIRAIV